MKRYKVEFLPSAKQDLRASFNWGVSGWGKTQAERWLRKFSATCTKRLAQFPESCPIAPESEELGRDIRHLIIARYRVLFIIQGNTVSILYVRGSYLGTMANEPDEEE